MKYNKLLKFKTQNISQETVVWNKNFVISNSLF